MMQVITRVTIIAFILWGSLYLSDVLTREEKPVVEDRQVTPRIRE